MNVYTTRMLFDATSITIDIDSSVNKYAIIVL